MFENLSDRLQNAIHKIKGYGKITEDNISEVMREVRLALLEADVNYKVVKEFTNNVKEKALGEEVQRSINPGDLFVKIVNDELIELLGGESSPLNLNGNPATLMLVGLQGSGKTTAIGKLANLLRKKHAKKPLLVACDVYRPAAIDQLKQIGKQLNIEVYEEGKRNPVEISKNAIAYAKENGYDYVLIDTAGRLHIDDEIFSGLFWTGDQALKKGLIDGFGSTGQVARDVIKIDNLVDYTFKQNLFEKVTKNIGAAIADELPESLGLKPGFR